MSPDSSAAPIAPPAGHAVVSIDVDESVLVDLRDRLARTRWPDQIDGAGWDYGAEISAVQRLCAYWLNSYDWRAAERQLNEWPQYTAAIDGANIHYAHIRSPEPDAFPLIMVHGWPGSIAEFLKVAGPLTNPRAHGGDPSDAFHLVLPCIPGYGLSGPTKDRGWNVARVASAFTTLMAQLGYDRYGTQGGDWGSIISTHIGAQDPGHVAGVHVNMVLGSPPDPEKPFDGVAPEEVSGLEYMGHFRTHETGYQEIQKTKPQTLAYGLTDSPAGLCGWILEKFKTWSDCNDDPFSVFTMDELCTNLMLYWFTGTINASTRLYYETLGPGRAAPIPRVEVPTGCALFPKELYQAPRVWAEKQYNVTHWSRFTSGGHFAAMEQPVALTNDIRAFFRTVR